MDSSNATCCPTEELCIITLMQMQRDARVEPAACDLHIPEAETWCSAHPAWLQR